MTEQTAAAPNLGDLRATPKRRFASLRVILALMLREMGTTYGRSPMGYLWAVLEPVAGIVIMTAVFSALVRTPPLGSNFQIFYATGMVPFMFYMDISGKILQTLPFSRALLVYPSVTFMDAILARLILNGLTQLLVAYFIFTSILLIFEPRVVLDLPAIGLGLAMAASLGFGIGVMNCFLVGMFHSWQRVWAIVNRPLFLISCIFFIFESIPEPYRSWLWYNPLVHVVAQIRKGFYPYYEADYISYIYVFSISLVLGVMGLVFLSRYFRHILHN